MAVFIRLKGVQRHLRDQQIHFDIRFLGSFCRSQLQQQAQQNMKRPGIKNRLFILMGLSWCCFFKGGMDCVIPFVLRLFPHVATDVELHMNHMVKCNFPTCKHLQDHGDVWSIRCLVGSCHSLVWTRRYFHSHWSGSLPFSQIFPSSGNFYPIFHSALEGFQKAQGWLMAVGGCSNMEDPGTRCCILHKVDSNW